MKSTDEIREAIRTGNVSTLTVEELSVFDAIESAPHLPSQCMDWADQEAVPLIRELAGRLRTLTNRRGRHQTLDAMLAEFLVENPGKLPNSVSLSEFLTWHADKLESDP